MSASLPSSAPAFITLAEGVLPTDFQVIFDANMLSYIAPQTLLISSAKFTADAPKVMGAPFIHYETYGIQCSLYTSVSPADNSGAARLTEAYDLYKAIAKMVNENGTLNGTVLYAWCRQLGYSARRDTQGRPYGQLDFEVVCNARVDPTN